ncbi:contactin-associated protein-like 2 [Branchiostoma floridae]|uniref:Contactin-associated protein-like 2 n=1 Tax=Branchiostoma floridae TaxID=7739 RepID=A0A9J7LT02_BRAFL|nr:contactin-associated protein-like 2 [Branchiostoma floridae]
MNHLVSLVVLLAGAHVGSAQSTQEVSAQCRYSTGGQRAYTFVLPPSSVQDCSAGSEQEVSELREIVQQLATKAQQQETKMQQQQDKVQELETKAQQQEDKVRQLETKVQQQERKVQQQEAEVQLLQTKVQVLETKILVDKCAEGHRLPGVPSCYHLWKLGCRQSGSYVVSSNVSDVYCDFQNFTTFPGDIPRTCSSLYHPGMASGEYLIDPDGPETGVEPFSVYCDVDLEPGKGVTVISHDSEARTHVRNGYAGAGTYMRDVTYSASVDQIRALIYVSQTCKQFIKYECFHTMINTGDTDVAWWVTWDGRMADYWGGATPGSGNCACGEEGTCDNGQPRCNCDNDDYNWRSDEGFLTHKSDLPVTQLRLGNTAGHLANGYHHLGKLRCS